MLCSHILYEVLTLTCVLVWRAGTLYWKRLFLRSLFLPLQHHRCLRLPLGLLAPPNSRLALYVSVTTPPAEQTRRTLSLRHFTYTFLTFCWFVHPSHWIIPYWNPFWRFCCFCCPAACCERILLWLEMCLRSLQTCSDPVCRFQLWVYQQRRVFDHGWYLFPLGPLRWSHHPSPVWCQW